MNTPATALAGPGAGVKEAIDRKSVNMTNCNRNTNKITIKNFPASLAKLDKK
jgi:hypothetical protein